MTKMKPSDAPPPAAASERGGHPVATAPGARPEARPSARPEARPIDTKVTRKPMARATRIALFQREIRERLSPAALDLIFARVEVISEGQRALRNGNDSYFGSTMLTIDLPALGAYLRDACDAGTARRLAALLEGDAGVARRIQELAEREATRVAGAVPKQVGAHVVIRSQGAKVFVDVDVEAVFV